MSLIPTFFADAVVAIGYEQHTGEIAWGASGFFYFHTVKGRKGRVYLVTNKHVLDKSDSIYIRVNPKALGEPKGYQLSLIHPATGESLWKGHYRKSVDVAVIPVNFAMFEQEDMQASYFLDKDHTLTTAQMEDAGHTEGNGIFTLGFPVSVVGDQSSSVIVRSGTIARIKDTLKSHVVPYLVDTVVFPGNSGGPVINKPELVAISGTKTINTANLIGIVASYVPYRDVAVSRQTGNPRVIFEENSGLSNVFSVDCIITTIRSFEKKLKQNIKEVQPKASKKASEDKIDSRLYPEH